MINSFMEKMTVPNSVILAVKLATNLDQISVVQFALAKMGLWKFWAYAIYFLFLA